MPFGCLAGKQVAAMEPANNQTNGGGKNIVLIGLPGAGKTYFGQRLAQMLGRKFVDLDDLAEKKAGKRIGTIFAEQGEAAFRALETETAREAALQSGIVIAAGGGIVLRAENMDILGENGIIVFLNRPPQQIARDIVTASRPLMQNDPARIHRLYEERIALYHSYCDFEIQNDGTVEGLQAKFAAIAAIAAKQQEMRFAVIGCPIGHSLSPNIHLPLLARFYEQVCYVRRELTEEQLCQWVSLVKREEFRGFNITMPHKKAIMPFLDHVDEEAVLLDAVNTVVNRNGVLTGYNTDAEGFHLALKENGKRFAGSTVVILGSGGVAGTLALKAAKEKAAKICIAAIDTEAAQRIATRIAEFGYDTEVQVRAFETAELARLCGEAELLLNCTPLGMTGIKENFTDTSFLQALPAQSMVCDLVYSPACTKLLQAAQNLGLATLGGIKMLVYQAILADDLFLGISQNHKKAYDIAIKNLPQTALL